MGSVQPTRHGMFPNLVGASARTVSVNQMAEYHADLSPIGARVKHQLRGKRQSAQPIAHVSPKQHLVA